MTNSSKPIHRQTGTGTALWGPGDLYTFLATGKETGGAYFQLECVIPPGGGPPPHIHNNEDETFYLIQGNLEMRLGDETIMAQAGDYVSIPKGTPHSFRNTGDETAKMIATFVPAGFEGWFEEAFTPAEDRNATPPPTDDALIQRMLGAADKYGLEFLPPES